MFATVMSRGHHKPSIYPFACTDISLGWLCMIPCAPTHSVSRKHADSLDVQHSSDEHMHWHKLDIVFFPTCRSEYFSHYKYDLEGNE